jgi:oligosaccharide reducing-end xylanase
MLIKFIGEKHRCELLKQAIIFFLMVFPVCGYTQVAADYEIARWYGFKQAAVTFTFDDNTSNQIPVAIPLLDSFGFKATFYPIISWNPDWGALMVAAAKGHEIASHTVSHPNFRSLAVASQDSELFMSKDIIEAKIPGYQCLTLAYPYCATGDMPLVSKYYIAARVCNGVIEKSTPDDFFRISSIIAGSLGRLKTGNDFNSIAAEAKISKGWCVYLIHGIDGDGGYSPLSSVELKYHLEYLKANSDDYWVATFVDVVKYIKERNSLELAETRLSAKKLQVEAKDNLDNNVYNFPVTISRKIPEGWRKIRVTCKGRTVQSFIRQTEKGSSVFFDVIPDSGPVVLVKL